MEPPRALVLDGSQRFQAMPKRFAKQGLTHLADATLVPLQARREQLSRDPGLRAQWLGECVSETSDGHCTEVSPLGKACWHRPVCRDLVQRPRRKKGAHTQGHRADTAHTPHGAPRNSTLSLIHSFIYSFIHSAVSLKHARHAHAQVTRETHHTRCTQAAFLKWCEAHVPLSSSACCSVSPLRRCPCLR